MPNNNDKKNELEASSPKSMDRREFMKRTALSAGAVAATMVAGGCGTSSSAAAPVVAPAVAAVGAKSSTAWKFAVMGDTQWLASDDGKNPYGTPVEIIRQLNAQFLAQGVQFVVQVGDLTENASKNTQTTPTTATKVVGGVTSSYTYTNLNAEDNHALFVQSLYNAGVGFFAHRGNHDADPTSATEFTRIYPQTQNGQMNATPADVLALTNPDASTQAAVAKSGSSFTVGSNFSSPGLLDVGSSNLKGLSYSFDFNNARFVLIDQFNPPDSKGPDGVAAYSINTTVALQQPWISKVLSNKPSSVQHSFVFSHKGLITQQHQDVLFGDCPSDTASAVYSYLDATGATKTVTKTGAVGMNDFIRTLSNNGVKLYFCGHDHIHNRSIVKTTAGTAAQVTHVLCQSCSSKFYTPNESNAAGNAPVPPATSNDAYYCPTSPASPYGQRQIQLSQEVYTVGYYIVTVDGANATVDYYSAPTYATFSSGTENQIFSTPALNFTKRETFGYGQNGKQFVLGQGDSFTSVKDTGPTGTTAAILSGTSNNPTADLSGRQYFNAVNTGWYPEASGTASDILSLLGMGYVMGSNQTDVFALSLSYDAAKGASFVLATPDGNGTWINAVDQNLGGAKTFVSGPWKAGYALGTYGIDAATKTVWAVINFNGYFAAVAGV
jgi:hypothetical protein